MEKLVSIIIPAYNGEQYLAQTLRSVCRQTYRHLEIIVVNDGSTDATESIVNGFIENDQRVVLITQDNKGLSAARNTGFKNAKGEYLCMFDADDIMLPQKIESQLSFLEENPRCDFVYSNVYHFIDGTQKIYFGVLPETADTYRSLVDYGNFINPNSVFFRRSIYERYGGFDEGLRGSEDWDYWLTLSRQGVGFCHLAKGLTLYRVRNTGLSGNRITVCSTAVRMLEKQRDYTQDAAVLKAFDLTLRSWKLRLLIAYLNQKDWSNAQQYEKMDGVFRTIYLLYRILPFSFISYMYELIKRIRFSGRFKKTTDQEIKQFLSI